jgi:hypothetical protein
MSIKNENPSDEDLVLGKFGDMRGDQTGSDSNSDSVNNAGIELEMRARMVKPYRKWVPLLMAAVVIITGVYIWAQYSSGLVTAVQTVSVSTPISAAIYYDGVVEISLQSNPVKDCDSGVLSCTPNQTIAAWREDGVLIVSVKRESPSSSVLTDAPPCKADQGTPNLGLIVLKSPNGTAPTAVIDGNTMKPIVTRVAESEAKAVKKPGFVLIPTQGTCISPAR